MYTFLSRYQIFRGQTTKSLMMYRWQKVVRRGDDDGSHRLTKFPWRQLWHVYFTLAGRARTARQQPWSSLTRWRWIDLGVRFQVRIKYRMPSFCIHFCAQYLKGKFCAGNFSMVESQAARMGHDDDRDAAPGSVPPALATSGLELETFCSNERLINRQPGGGMKIGRCCHVTPHHIRKVRRG